MSKLIGYYELCPKCGKISTTHQIVFGGGGGAFNGYELQLRHDDHTWLKGEKLVNSIQKMGDLTECNTDK
jgi:hypothetical protein